MDNNQSNRPVAASPSSTTSSVATTGTQARKFAPRAGIQKKTKAEREQYAREEQARQQARLAEATVAGRGGSAGTGRGRGRGRGAAITASTAEKLTGGGGVFGGAVSVAGMGGRGRGGAGRERGEGLSEVIRELEGVGVGRVSLSGLERGIGVDGDEKGASTSSRKKVAGAASAAGKSGQPIYVASDDEVEEGATRDIERIWISSDEEEAEEDIIGRKGKQREKPLVRVGKGLRPVRAPRLLRDGEGPAGAAKVDGDEMDIDEQFTADGPSSPELSKKAPKKKAVRAKESKVPTETMEERAERLRYNDEMRKLREELVPAQPAMLGDAMQLDNLGSDAQDEKLYLFQFPPLTPFLVDADAQIEVNEALEDPLSAHHDASSKMKKDTGAEVKQETDTGEESKANVKIEVPGALTARSMRLPPGRIGKLNVHKSGKVSLDWGGADMEVRYGNEVDFLQDAVLVGGEGEAGRSSWALGQVKTKLVVIPDWQKLYD